MVSRHPPFWKFNTVDPTSPWFTRSCMKSHKWKFAKLGTVTIFLKFWLRDRYPICIHGPRAHCSTSIVEQVTSEVVNIMFTGTALGLSFREHKHMWKWPNLSIQFQRQCFINPWIQPAFFLIIAVAAMAAAVSWQFAGWISPIPLQMIISISTDYIPALLTTYGVYNVVEYFSRNE